jgi:hypothetical protein
VFDASVRLSYLLGTWSGGLRPRVYLDLFQLTNHRTALALQDFHYIEIDNGTLLPIPSFGEPVEFQSPRSARLGLTIDFGGPE